MILTQANAFAHITYENGDWWVTDGKDVSYTILKDDRPAACPSGMVGIAGSYLLETDGFCIDQDYETIHTENNTASSPHTSLSVPDVQVDEIIAECSDRNNTSESGYYNISSINEALTVFQNAQRYDEEFFSELKKYEDLNNCPSNWTKPQRTRSFIINENSDYVIYRVNRYIKSGACYGDWGFSEIFSLPTDEDLVSRKVVLDRNDCYDPDYAGWIEGAAGFNNTFTLNKNSTNGLLESDFDSVYNFHATVRSEKCRINPFINFNGGIDDANKSIDFDFFNDAKAIGLFGDTGNWPTDTPQVIYLNLKRYGFSNIPSSIGWSLSAVRTNKRIEGN